MEFLRHHHDTHDPAALLRIVIENQFIIFQEIRAMSASVQAQLDALTNAQTTAATTFQAVADGIAKEIQQLTDAIGGGGFTPAQTAQLQASIDGLTTLNASMQTAVTSLAGDDPAPAAA